MTDLAQKIAEIKHATSGLLSIEQVAAQLGISVKMTSAGVRAGHIESLLVLGRAFVPIEALVGLRAAHPEPRAALFLAPSERAQLPSRPSAIARRSSAVPELKAGQ